MIEALFKDSSSVATRYKETLGALDMARRGGGGERVARRYRKPPVQKLPGRQGNHACA
jgi:hypothetical protein